MPTTSHSTWYSYFLHLRGLVLALILIGMGLRWNLWAHFRLREDEALYGYWAWMIYSGIDPMLKTVPVDKPPLFPYLLAWLYGIFTPSEVVLRLPSLLASTLSLPLLYGWARDVLDRRHAVVALALYVFMPLAVLMSPTAYMDAFMTGLLLLSAWMAARTFPSRVLWAVFSGLAFSAAVVTKSFAVLWLPIILFTAFQRRPRLTSWLMGFVVGAAWPLWRWWQWESLRSGPATWELAVTHYGGQAFLSPRFWLTHFLQWVPVWVTGWGGVLPFGLVVVLTIFGVLTCVEGKKSLSGLCLMPVWLGVMGGLFLITTLQPWDRYLLLLAPVWILVVSMGWEKLACRMKRCWRAGLILMMLWVGVQAGRGGYPLGGDHGAYNGLDETVDYVMHELPRGGIVYHHWLGWHYGFYLFGAPYDFRWWPDIAWLVEDWTKNDRTPRLIVLPAWRENERYLIVRELERSSAGIRLVKRIYDREGHLRFWIYSTKQQGGRR